ncbi:hypothetical protein [Microbacterium capsulatum]|uniref:Uncharacterized protein n=1 Tax=Microbacterium capsulatum TaxID=3041921 RepID=A0ABU0XG13_9MICO|nr:hypothetical protein [Microbacterium sp. ASV81]MDQ4214061.1 hypothetical protein [Microbacterium sp. ASV81]
MFSFGFVTRVIIATAPVITAATIFPNVAQAAVANDLVQLAQIQQMGVASDGTYPDRFGSLENTFCAADLVDTFGAGCDDRGRNLLGVVPLNDFAVSYALSAGRTHYVLARQLRDGSVLAVSDTVRLPVTCESYNYECLTQLTDDEGLRNSVPGWQSL